MIRRMANIVVDPAVTRDFLRSKGVPPALLEQFWNPRATTG